jgi:hypothetical protein
MGWHGAWSQEHGARKNPVEAAFSRDKLDKIFPIVVVGRY